MTRRRLAWLGTGLATIALAGTMAATVAPPPPGATAANAGDVRDAPVDKGSPSLPGAPALLGPEGRRIVVPLANPVP